MNRFVFIICFFCFWVSTDAQNLIYNGSFEEYYSCPVSNDLGNGQLELAKGWWKPTQGTSDYFNACNNGIVSVPTNFVGYQYAQDGQGYVGIGAMEWFDDGTPNTLEYIQTRLLEKLKPCSKYYFSMYVSLADKSEYAIGDLSAFFTSDSITIQTYLSIGLEPQFVNNGSPIIDTMNWTKIEGYFVADGTEEYLTIGYKSEYFANDTLFLQNLYDGVGVGYYLVDNVFLMEFEQVPIEDCNLTGTTLPNIITPNNDGINDFINLDNLSSFYPKVKIVNRWGNVVGELDANNTIWTGDNLSDGVYFYFLEYSIGNKEYKQNGFIQLLR